MQVTLSLHERFLLETWLPRESQPGAPQTDVRSLVATGQTLDPSEVQDRLAKIRTCLNDLRAHRSMLAVRPPLGRGFTSRHPGGLVSSRMSPWEEAWLVVDRVKAAGRLATPALAAKELEDALRAQLVNAIAIAVLCLETAAEGRQLAQGVAADPSCAPPDRAWLLWLAGDGSVDLAGNLTDHLIGASPQKALAAALSKHWSQVEELLPKSLRKAFPKPIQPSGTRMHGQFLAQLASYALRGAPSREVLDASLAALFRFFGFDKESAWWDGREIMTRLPLLALYARVLDLDSPGAVLLHAQRSLNLHLVEPPPRTFVGPAEVVAAVEKLESAFAAAAAGARGLSVSLTGDGNSYAVS